MTSHELARQLLAGPDKKLAICIKTATNSLWADPGDVQVTTDVGDVNIIGRCTEVDIEVIDERED